MQALVPRTYNCSTCSSPSNLWTSRPLWQRAECSVLFAESLSVIIFLAEPSRFAKSRHVFYWSKGHKLLPVMFCAVDRDQWCKKKKKKEKKTWGELWPRTGDHHEAIITSGNKIQFSSGFRKISRLLPVRSIWFIAQSAADECFLKIKWSSNKWAWFPSFRGLISILSNWVLPR